jgi:hypothetical protein
VTFVQNNLVSETIHITPFFANARQNPKMFFDHNISAGRPEAFNTQNNIQQLKKI